MVASKGKRILIGKAPLEEVIRGVLYERIRFVVDIIDVTQILQAVLEEYFYGESAQQSAVDMLLAYCVPSDVARRAVEQIEYGIEEQITRAVGKIRPANQYSFDMRAYDIIIAVVPPHRIFQHPLRQAS